MPRRKIVFVIVEGPSDHTALELLLNRAFDPARVHVHIVYGDITAEYGSEYSNILNRVDGMVTAYRVETHFSKASIQEIVHIVDMDGAFIPDEAIIEDPANDKAFYSLNEIRTAHPDEIQYRNQIKRANLSRLSSVKEIGGIPYQVYYMSCNLDHVLYNKQNSTDEEKEHDSAAFAIKYKNDFDGFLTLMNDPDLLVCHDYVQSWRYIKIGLHSLERHSNLGICLNAAVKEE